MWRRLPGGWLLSGTVPGDAEAMAAHLADGRVARWLLRVPIPYRLEDARAFLELAKEDEARAGRTTQFAVRGPEGELVGLVGLGGVPRVHTVADKPVEIGFWIAPSHWGRGIAREAVRRVVNVALVEYELDHLVAGILDGNEASTRTLVGVGFELREPHVDLRSLLSDGSVGGEPRWGARYALSYERYEKLEKAKSK